MENRFYRESATMRRVMYQVDLRRNRALSLASTIMQELKPFINQDDINPIMQQIEILFCRLGVEVITDADRQMAGLPQRDNRGWTNDELEMLELARKQNLLKVSCFYDPASERRDD